MSAIDKIIDVYDENVEDSEWVSEARAELAQLRTRIDALENDIVCAFCGAHYKADDVPPQHYMTCEQSPLVQRIAEQARQLAEARQAMLDSIGLDDAIRPGCTCPICTWLALYDAPQEAPDEAQ